MSKLHFPINTQDAKRLSRLVTLGRLHRVRQGIYVDADAINDVNSILQAEWVNVANYLFDNPLAAFRTAVELRPIDGHVFLVANISQRKKIKVGELQFEVFPGDTSHGLMRFNPVMLASNVARQCLENLAIVRPRKNAIAKTLGAQWVETRLIHELGTRGEAGLNALRDEAKDLAQVMGLEREYKFLYKMVSAILSTHSVEGILNTGVGIAHAKGVPFDDNRVQLFRAFADYIVRSDLGGELAQEPFEYTKSAWRNVSFFESYFSNYIEGTRFTIDEAEDIVFENRTVENRHADSHDVMAHMEITADLTEMMRTPNSAADFIDILKVRHAILMAERPDKQPGVLKRKSNRAGSTIFVGPDYVEGTLMQGYELYRTLPSGLARGMYIHFLVAECHPFDDGNGRIARLMMNAELVADDAHKIIVPTVHRESYLNGMRQASQKGRFRAIIKVLHQLQAYTASIRWSDYGEAREALENHGATMEPDEGVPIFNRVLKEFGGHYLPG